MAGVGLTEDDLEVAETSEVRHVELSRGGIAFKGRRDSVTLDELQALLDRLNEIEGRQAPSVNLGEDLTAQLRNVIDYPSENCALWKA